MAANKPKEVQPGYTGECNPEIFNLSARPEIKEKKPGQLNSGRNDSEIL